jgi:hypothetical protein
LKSVPCIIAAIVTIGALEAYALHLGHDGVILASTIAVIAGLAGFGGGYLTGLYKPVPPAESENKP